MWELHCSLTVLFSLEYYKLLCTYWADWNLKMSDFGDEDEKQLLSSKSYSDEGTSIEKPLDRPYKPNCTVNIPREPQLIIVLT